MLTCNGKKSSGNETQFSKLRFAILEKLHKLRNWIKLLFLPSVAKRSSVPKLSKSDFKINTIIKVGSPEVGRILTREENLMFCSMIAKLSKVEIVTLNSIFQKLHKHNIKMDIASNDKV